MNVHVFTDADAVAREAARQIADEARAAIAARGRFTLAVSGGRTPWVMLRALAGEQIPWKEVHIFQVDERVAPFGHADRNLTHIQQCFASNQGAVPTVHAMPVEDPALEDAARAYSRELQACAGTPPVVDLAHLGLGADGHTASLVPGDAALRVRGEDVAVTAEYQGRRRMTLTYPVIDRARRILWVITGSEKAEMLSRLIEGDESIPAGRVRRDAATVLADRAAADHAV